jgi:hypothetical protein
MGGLDVADRLPKGGWSADLLTEVPTLLVEAVSEPFGAGGGADVLIILILSPQIRAFQTFSKIARHIELSVPRSKILACEKSHIALVKHAFLGLSVRSNF